MRDHFIGEGIDFEQGGNTSLTLTLQGAAML
jgi:hypothetical protein